MCTHLAIITPLTKDYGKIKVSLAILRSLVQRKVKGTGCLSFSPLCYEPIK